MRFGLLLKLLPLYILFISPVQANSLMLDELLSVISQRGSFETAYKEEKMDDFLEIPIYMTGTVSFVAPDYVKKTVGTPVNQWFELNGEVITIAINNGEEKTYSVNELPEIRILFESFRSILSGDADSLKKYYTVELTGNINQWQIDLTPRNKKLSYRLGSMLFSGRGKYILQVVTTMRNGNNSIMEFDAQE